MVEFAFTLMLFLVIVLAIAEFAILTMNISRTGEVTRELGRIAIVRDPICDIYGGACPGAVSGLACPGGAAVSVTLADVALDCGADPGATGCLMLDYVNQLDDSIADEQIRVTYACSTTGSEDRPLHVPLVTVAVEGLTHDFIFPSLFGLEDIIDIPPFETTRTGEDLYTERLP